MNALLRPGGLPGAPTLTFFARLAANSSTARLTPGEGPAGKRTREAIVVEDEHAPWGHQRPVRLGVGLGALIGVQAVDEGDVEGGSREGCSEEGRLFTGGGVNRKCLGSVHALRKGAASCDFMWNRRYLREQRGLIRCALLLPFGGRSGPRGTS